MNLKLKDNLNNRDKVSFEYNKSPYVRTQIIGGYEPYKDKNGITQFGEVIFEETNMIVLGGALFTLEKVFGITSPLTIGTLYDVFGIPEPDNNPVTDNKDTYVKLFGVGTGGAGESLSDVKDVKFHEREIIDMIPLRQTADLTPLELERYWFRRPVTVGGVNKTAYYLKTFDHESEIHVLWKDSVDDYEDGSEVSGDVYLTQSTTPIETFVENTFTISRRDIVEYFRDNGNIEVARINSIGLFTGVKREGDTDYKDIRLFSKLNINNDVFTNPRDLTIAYRIFAS